MIMKGDIRTPFELVVKLYLRPLMFHNRIALLTAPLISLSA